MLRNHSNMPSVMMGITMRITFQTMPPRGGAIEAVVESAFMIFLHQCLPAFAQRALVMRGVSAPLFIQSFALRKRLEPLRTLKASQNTSTQKPLSTFMFSSKPTPVVKAEDMQ